jgi:hypothetical protein
MEQLPRSGVHIHIFHVKVRRFILRAHSQHLQHRSWYVLAATRIFMTVLGGLKHACAISLHSRIRGTYMTKIHACGAQSAAFLNICKPAKTKTKSLSTQPYTQTFSQTHSLAFRHMQKSSRQTTRTSTVLMRTHLTCTMCGLFYVFVFACFH